MSGKYEAVLNREKLVFAPGVRRWPLALDRGAGSKVWDVEGREFLDLTAGWGVTSIGHCHPALAEAIADQASKLMQTTNVVYSEPQLDLAERIARISPANMQHSFFTSSGAEANEGALKLAVRRTGRSKFVATLNSFHGRTLGAMGCLGQEKYRKPWAGIVHEADFAPYGDLAAAQQLIDKDVAAVIVEPIQGEGGVVVPPADYLTGLEKACRDVGALLILDEVQTCCGRTGRWMALEHSGVQPDILTFGKGIGGGVPIAAFSATDDVMNAIVPGDHGGTYAGNLLACRAAATVMKVIEDDGLVENARVLGDHIMERFGALAKRQADKVEAVRGAGLLVGLVLRDAELAAAVHPETRERGVLVNLTAERVIRLFPALNIPRDELDQALDVIEAVVEKS
ncbi:MAG: aspartate aminotransferase family protein [bacterium]|nr:aspartate aminotransferase family protein [bacterium]